MAICPYCGANINNHYKYCPQCGKSQPEKHSDVTQVINGIQADLDRRMAQEDFKISREIDLSSWKFEAEAAKPKAQPKSKPRSKSKSKSQPTPKPQPKPQPTPKPQPKPEPVPQPKPRPLRQPNVDGLYEDYQTRLDREADYEEEEPYLGSPLLRGLILLVSGLLVVAVAFGLLLILHPLGNAPAEEPTSIVEEEPTPAPTPEPTPTPELVEPVRDEKEQLICDLLTVYYHSYLSAINQQDPDLLERTSLRNLEAARSRILSGPNAQSIYAEDDFSIDVDLESLQTVSDGSILVNVHMVFHCAPRSGGNSERVDNWQTFLLTEGAGEDGWIVDRSERLSQNDYTNHKYAFLP